MARQPPLVEGVRSSGPGTWVAEPAAFLSSANKASQTLLPAGFGTASNPGARAGRRQREAAAARLPPCTAAGDMA